jgi:hypothetical protein
MLAGRLGRTVEEIGRMSWLEFSMWGAAYSVDPWGLPDVFLQHFGEKGDGKIRDPEKMKAALLAMAKAGKR